MISLTELREEVKFLSTSRQDFITDLYANSFKKQFDNRRILSIYYDTDNLLFYRNHVDGSAERLKYRLRTYSKNLNEVINFNLEIKIKSFDLGFKKKIDKYASINNINDELPLVETNMYGYLKPVLAVLYDREYFNNYIQKYRATIDSNLTFLPIINNKVDQNKKVVMNNLFIQEKKINDRSIASTKFQNNVKFSKYICAVNELQITNYN